MRLRLYYPVRPYVVNQHFGSNYPCVKDFGLPTQNIIVPPDVTTCPIGYDKLYPHFGMAGHNGTDLGSGVQNIYASCDGVVVEKQTVPARGLGVGILTNEQYDFGALGTHFIKIRYWHLKVIYCEVGDTIHAGDLIGISNNTGYSSGDHLHFEGQPMDKDAGGHPYLAFNAAQPGVIASAIDIEPYFVGIYADQVAGIILNLRARIAALTLKLASLIKGRS